MRHHRHDMTLAVKVALNPNTTNQPIKLKEFTDDNFKFRENGRKFPKQVENTVRKREIAGYKQFLPFPVFSKDLYCRHVENHGLFEKGLTKDRKHCEKTRKMLFNNIFPFSSCKGC